ncbi:TetR/AcrR family transcriptional regulator [Pseudodesulfovibrio indicus]|jgi:TetR/AcrR family transcriptional repressor of nem operon|uniref:TetR family transcriptional regulator n=1 Tax=Pseudodesulfovibrio indicus TaxID=1716143 RepID=A0A126QNA5_9BACT|nr:TetR/AcrR family transcriptional regulator [Pseudodesulfovibrio indicus]AMK11452.1 TetR family transcriptional regulator [Pseudodesulfovibrio indicus]TDT89846.1 TetR family transcriptional regulator [Pseudodesulfovibrio indicus]
MSEDTRRRILQAGANLVHERGFNNTGLKDILKAAGVPKGSFYFYFDNKESFGIEMVEHFDSAFREIIADARNTPGLPPLDKLRRIFDGFAAHFESYGYTRGCPIGNLAQEMGDLSEPFRARLRQALDGMSKSIADILDDAVESGDLPPATDTWETAVFVVEAWHGAIIRMKVTKDGEPLRLCNRFIFDKILK